ncbi:hypothetical protein [Streptomyces hyaluromycini]|uniref:hypothetical protein n=1 Tax=Streptomyces hyaluromycini TaxID=1377993 RepID=UPI000B5C5766|nr:hypothetical protein [Streptomyces hyaluromycini]
MSTGLIIAIVIVAAVVVVAAVLAVRSKGSGPHGLKRRFGPEYERTVAQHGGDTRAAEQELAERVQRHGALHERDLEPAERERYAARWTTAQEHFVDSPRESVTEIDRLLAELAADRGFPAGAEYEDQVAALSVHHADHVDGYRRVHRAAEPPTAGSPRSRAGTEEMRAAVIEARFLFDDLVTPSSRESGRHRAGVGAGTGGRLPWSADQSRPKES